MNAYKSGDYCQAIDCKVAKNRMRANVCPTCEAYQFHTFLRERGQILEQGSKLAKFVKASQELANSYGKDSATKMNAWHHFVEALSAAGLGVEQRENLWYSVVRFRRMCNVGRYGILGYFLRARGKRDTQGNGKTETPTRRTRTSEGGDKIDG